MAYIALTVIVGPFMIFAVLKWMEGLLCGDARVRGPGKRHAAQGRGPDRDTETTILNL